jgi:hypothetical protein
VTFPSLAFNQPAGHREGICSVLLDQSPLCQRFAESYVGTFHFGLNEAAASKAGRSSSALPSEGARDDVRRVGSRNERLSNPLVMDIQWRGIAMAKPSEKEIAARAYKLWQENGMPEGKDEMFWQAAEQELLNEDKSNPMRTPDTL